MTFVASDRRVLGTCVHEFRVILIVALRVDETEQRERKQNQKCCANDHLLLLF